MLQITVGSLFLAVLLVCPVGGGGRYMLAIVKVTISCQFCQEVSKLMLVLKCEILSSSW